ncbi:pyruvate ferredoxin oxidoreductase subunit gamma [Candidatus Hecatella orcuttiae]|jgi:2-oxoacid:acceptor oxidoreductase gamma subunit (pyruvate/2-ketoisovalerate family)|uniref:pyruvate ferredoxin oxidoreductase subunit gamma n=1 Tax=Candidatus Hecatella orcuttiae TaxID=1935119 RepID=UPI002867C9FE|nr:pyruvate ferredoxin oxidoreductase subunit gamma [Candidatus Hecatella orcuttiae]
MKEIRWHGRGGQGVVTVSQLLAYAALREGKYVQAFPEFGPERTGAPVLGFTRISEKPIHVHSQVYEPDVAVVLDPTLMGGIDVAEGLKGGGCLVVNTDVTPQELRKQIGRGDVKMFTVNATRIALDTLGRPIFNTAMLGALVKAADLVSLDSVVQVVRERFSGKIAESNIAAIRRAYEEVRADG